MEYTRARLALHREIQDYSARGCFVRVPNALDEKGNVRIVMGDRHGRLAKQDTLLHALLSLAHKETTLTKAIGVFEVATIGIGMDAFKEPNTAEDQAFNYLLHVAELFIKNMPLIFVMPPFWRTLEAMLVTKPRTLKARTILAKPHLDIARIMPSIVGRQEACAVHSALNMLAECTRQFSGSSVPEMDESVIRACLAQIKNQSSCPQLEPNVGQEVQQQCDATVEAATARKSPPMTTEDNAAQPASLKKKKNKSKGKSKPVTHKQAEPAPEAHPLLRRTALTQRVPPTQRIEPPQRKIRVSPSAAQVFTTLFDRSESRSGLHWASFEAAMAELNFRITPRQGSSILFEPPKNLALRSSLTVHRPHGPRVEGFRTLILSQRLARTFGWDAETFVSR
ncbi:hypothetical protein MY11210_000181 [Beauveria gryllotalpidicola]